MGESLSDRASENSRKYGAGYVRLSHKFLVPTSRNAYITREGRKFRDDGRGLETDEMHVESIILLLPDVVSEDSVFYTAITFIDKDFTFMLKSNSYANARFC